SNEGSYKVLIKLLHQGGVILEGKRVLEIGSGWAPVMPYFMLYQGKAKSVATFDLNRHFSKKNTERLNEVFIEEYAIHVAPELSNTYKLPKNINYHPETDLTKVDLPETEIVFSRFVLEHVKPEDILKMHIKFKEELKPGATIVHLISPSDHRAYVDNNLSLQDFLKFGKTQWQKKQSKFDYHNRLRLPEYLSIFKAAGLEVKHVEYENPKPGSEALKKFRKIKLHEDYKVYTEVELTAGSINIVLKV
ncbi:methyltransferase domain-containing protein, partial [Salinimicrobium oceani]|uniref:methyltransferase domain-containing protein n=1 Tax=Salinimicrobium oceani TaxID=2722702 RepID=UPI001ADDC85E